MAPVQTYFLYNFLGHECCTFGFHNTLWHGLITFWLQLTLFLFILTP